MYIFVYMAYVYNCHPLNFRFGGGGGDVTKPGVEKGGREGVAERRETVGPRRPGGGAGGRTATLHNCGGIVGIMGSVPAQTPPSRARVRPPNPNGPHPGPILGSEAPCFVEAPPGRVLDAPVGNVGPCACILGLGPTPANEDTWFSNVKPFIENSGE